MSAVNVSNPQLRERAKDQSVIIGPLEWWLESQPSSDDRDSKVIHPSELSRDDFCPRGVWHRIAGHPVTNPIAGHSAHLQRVFQEGSDVHTKYQAWLWRMGTLIGEFGCLICKHAGRDWRWWATAPTTCQRCQAERQYLAYLEVPIVDTEHLIKGRADGRVMTDLLEIKTVGKGSVRLEAPELYSRWEQTAIVDGEEKQWVDLDGLWRAIKRPFRSHLRQGTLYLHASGLDRMIFIYEAKWNQSRKEFVIGYRPEVIEPLLETCLDIKYALKTGWAPTCPHGGCETCHSYEGADNAPANRRHLTLVGNRDDRRSSGVGEGGLQGPPQADHRPAESAWAANGSDRRRADGALVGPDAVVRPHRRVVGTPRGRRTTRGLGI